MLDLKGRDVRVNVLSPDPTRTPGLAGLAGSDPAMQERLLAGMAAEAPLGRIGTPDGVVAAALFLASEEARFMTGSKLFVDGGTAQV